MAINFIVEDGTGLSTATAYLSVDDLKQLWDNVGYSYSNISTVLLQQRINKATEVIDGQYTSLWPGTRKTETQALDWPREDAVYIDGTDISEDIVPPELKRAVSELVYAQQNGTEVQPTHSSSGTISKESVRVDVIQRETTYTEYSSQDISRDTVVAVLDALARIIGSTSGSAFVNLDILRI